MINTIRGVLLCTLFIAFQSLAQTMTLDLSNASGSINSSPQ